MPTGEQLFICEEDTLFVERSRIRSMVHLTYHLNRPIIRVYSTIVHQQHPHTSLCLCELTEVWMLRRVPLPVGVMDPCRQYPHSTIYSGRFSIILASTTFQHLHFNKQWTSMFYGYLGIHRSKAIDHCQSILLA